MASKVEEKEKDKHYVRNERKRHTRPSLTAYFPSLPDFNWGMKRSLSVKSSSTFL